MENRPIPYELQVDENRQRFEVYASMRWLYQAYVRHLLLSAVGAAAVAALAASIIQSGALTTPFGNALITVGLLLIPVLCISWAGGWAYLNLELWAHRHYLTYLERRAAESNATGRLYLYPHVIQEVVYQTRPARRLFGGKKRGAMTYHTHLDWLVALFPSAVGLGAMASGSYILWQGMSLAWRTAAVVYAVLMLGLYIRVFYIKIIVSNELKERLRIEPAQPDSERG